MAIAASGENNRLRVLEQFVIAKLSRPVLTDDDAVCTDECRARAERRVLYRTAIAASGENNRRQLSPFFFYGNSPTLRGKKKMLEPRTLSRGFHLGEEAFGTDVCTTVAVLAA